MPSASFSISFSPADCRSKRRFRRRRSSSRISPKSVEGSARSRPRSEHSAAPCGGAPSGAWRSRRPIDTKMPVELLRGARAGACRPSKTSRSARRAVALRCATCGTLNPASQKFCGECGTPITSTGPGLRSMAPMPSQSAVLSVACGRFPGAGRQGAGAVAFAIHRAQRRSLVARRAPVGGALAHRRGASSTTWASAKRGSCASFSSSRRRWAMSWCRPGRIPAGPRSDAGPCAVRRSSSSPRCRPPEAPARMGGRGHRGSPARPRRRLRFGVAGPGRRALARTSGALRRPKRCAGRSSGRASGRAAIASFSPWTTCTPSTARAATHARRCVERPAARSGVARCDVFAGLRPGLGPGRRGGARSHRSFDPRGDGGPGAIRSAE